MTAALTSEGFETIAWDGDARESSALASVQCYVQLPGDDGHQPTGAEEPFMGRVVDHVDALSAVVPLLARDAAVVVVVDESRWDRRRLDALRLLAEAVVADLCPGTVRVSILADPVSPAALAAALRQPRDPAPSLASLSPEQTYADWRNDVLNMATTTDATYLGWRDRNGDQRVAVLRGAVLSPLEAVGADDSAILAWSHDETSAEPLARAVVADLLGPEARCAPWHGSIRCPTCCGRGLRRSALALARALFTTVLSRLPTNGFELAASDLMDWLAGHPLHPAIAAQLAERTGAPLAAHNEGATPTDSLAPHVGRHTPVTAPHIPGVPLQGTPPGGLHRPGGEGAGMAVATGHEVARRRSVRG